MRVAFVAALLVSVGWVTLIIGAPRWISPPPDRPAHAIAAAVYAAGNRICHQRPDRSLRIAGVPMPVCARCTGLYLGVPIGLALAAWRLRPVGRRSPIGDRAARAVLTAAALPTIVTVALEALAGIATPPLARLALAVPLAGLAAWVGAERLAAESHAGGEVN